MCQDNAVVGEHTKDDLKVSAPVYCQMCQVNAAASVYMISTLVIQMIVSVDYQVRQVNFTVGVHTK